MFLAFRRHRNYDLLPKTGFLERIRGFVHFLQVHAMIRTQQHLTTLPNPQFITSLLFSTQVALEHFSTSTAYGISDIRVHDVSRVGP
jgi:hypothetical protein